MTEENKGPEIAPEDQGAAQAAAIEGAQAVQRGASPDEVQQVIEKALEKQSKSLSDSDIEKVADALVAKFEEMGAFENANANPTHAETPALPATSTGTTPTGEPAPSGETLAPATPTSDPTPRKGKFADRFLREH